MWRQDYDSIASPNFLLAFGLPTSNDDALILKLAVALAAQMQLPIPVSIDLWDVAMIARVLKRSESMVRNRLICLPVAGGGQGQPLYKATEVLEWTQKYRDRH